MTKKCIYHELGAEMSNNIENGNMRLEKGRDGKWYISASSASQLGLNPSEVTSHEVTYCPFCGSSLGDDEDKIDKQGD